MTPSFISLSAIKPAINIAHHHFCLPLHFSSLSSSSAHHQLSSSPTPTFSLASSSSSSSPSLCFLLPLVVQTPFPSPYSPENQPPTVVQPAFLVASSQYL
ncbi:hypothetical protein Dimus_002106 [Dionaea muscipula]